MKNGNTNHLTNDQLLWALVDTDDLSSAARGHLSECPRCRSEKTRLEEELGGMRRMAEQTLPSAIRPVKLPIETPRGWRRLSVKWVAAASIAASATALVLILWVAGILQPRSETPVAVIAREQAAAVKLMTDVNRLVENPLPPVYLKITGETSAGLDEEFFRFLIPQENDIS